MNEVFPKLEELKTIDKQLTVFGSSSHEYQLNPPLSAKAVETIEAKYGCSLPEDYKYFITNIGNGGAGPFYGVFPLGQQDDNYDMRSWDDGYLIGDLSKPFPHTQHWNLPDAFWKKQPSPDECETEEEEDAQWEAWEKELETHYWAPHIMHGAIPICHQGCAIRTWLVVTGPMQGTVWDDYRCDNAGISPLKNEDGKYLSFSEWYSDWLDQSLLEAKSIRSHGKTNEDQF